jgi:GNAT superfamily N-acetyltransferase
MGENVTIHPKAREANIIGPARLTPSHDVSRFECEKPVLNEWLRNHALSSEGMTARTYVVCESNVVIGYYCIATGSIERQQLPSKQKRQQGLPNQIPVGIIGRLARDVRYKGRGLGSDLLYDALKRVIQAAEIIGIRAVLVHALDEDSIPFYEKNGFTRCSIGERTFFLPIETIIRAL